MLVVQLTQTFSLNRLVLSRAGAVSIVNHFSTLFFFFFFFFLLSQTRLRTCNSKLLKCTILTIPHVKVTVKALRNLTKTPQLVFCLNLYLTVIGPTRMLGRLFSYDSFALISEQNRTEILFRLKLYSFSSFTISR